ncbi:MAG: isocitrate/isopropylmalate family dehydrogenase, partial [Marinobacterium sp.]
MNENKVLILPGDGIGPEIVAQARRVLELVNDQDNLGLEFDEAHVGGAAIDATGVPLPEETLA